MQAHTLDCYKGCYTYLTLGEIWDLWTGHGLHLTARHKICGTYGQNITGNTALTDCVRRDTPLVDCNVHQNLWTEPHRGFRTSGRNFTGNVMGLVTELPTFKRYQSYGLTLRHTRRTVLQGVYMYFKLLRKSRQSRMTLTLKL